MDRRRIGLRVFALSERLQHQLSRSLRYWWEARGSNSASRFVGPTPSQTASRGTRSAIRTQSHGFKGRCAAVTPTGNTHGSALAQSRTASRDVRSVAARIRWRERGVPGRSRTFARLVRSQAAGSAGRDVGVAWGTRTPIAALRAQRPVPVRRMRRGVAPAGIAPASPSLEGSRLLTARP